ncbi:MAG: MarR family transcriptional regulator [Synergistales bacterium]|nr:MarR family transcriptional regulator [Synergistaceae bacterium]MDD4611620.1 MarR family transcriptional regulator [Synergistaceae bacterium]NCC57198.1 MarR family transcriptional regulator [Synergistales bacterium]
MTNVRYLTKIMLMNEKNSILSIIYEIHESIQRIIGKQIGKYEDGCLVPSHAELLYILSSGQGITMGELAKKVHKTKPTVTVLVDKLERCGFVERQKSSRDHRVYHIRLTEKGRTLKPFFDSLFSGIEHKFFEGFSDEDTEATEQSLLRIAENLKEEK